MQCSLTRHYIVASLVIYTKIYSCNKKTTTRITNKLVLQLSFQYQIQQEIPHSLNVTIISITALY